MYRQTSTSELDLRKSRYGHFGRNVVNLLLTSLPANLGRLFFVDSSRYLDHLQDVVSEILEDDCLRDLW